MIIFRSEYEPCTINNIHNIFHKYELEQYIYIQLPKVKDFNLLYSTVIKLFDLAKQEEVYPANIIREDRTCIKILTSDLDISAGYHIYRFEFSKPKQYITEEIEPYSPIYLDYTIIDDDPPKPYIYMR